MVFSKSVIYIVKMSCPVCFIPCPQYLLLNLAHEAPTYSSNEYFMSIGAVVGGGALRGLPFDPCFYQVCP